MSSRFNTNSAEVPDRLHRIPAIVGNRLFMCRCHIPTVIRPVTIRAIARAITLAITLLDIGMLSCVRHIVRRITAGNGDKPVRHVSLHEPCRTIQYRFPSGLRRRGAVGAFRLSGSHVPLYLCVSP